LNSHGLNSRSAKLLRLLPWLTALLMVLPLLSARYLPLTDFPEHAATMHTLAELATRGSFTTPAPGSCCLGCQGAWPACCW
jgi:hypothetical protein